MLFEHPYKSQFSPTHYVRYKIFSKFCRYLLWTFKRPPLKFLLIHIHLSFRFLKVFWTTLMNAFTTTDWHTKTTMCMCNCIMIRVAKCQFFYTERNRRTKFYPKKNVQIRTILAQNWTKLTQRILLENNCSSIYQVKLVYTH